jgi:hypothetical protein
VTPRQTAVAVLAVIVVFGAWLRLSGANWDDGQHLHPDERYLSIVADNVRWPSSPVQYLDVHDSPLSPYNTEQGRGYLYGQLPLFATKLAATALGRDDYGRLNIVGRRFSALVDAASIVLVFLLGLILFESFGPRATTGALFASALYAVTVAGIQAAHFFTMESWLIFFTLLTFYLAARVVRAAAAESPSRFRLVHLALGASLGLTVACKVSGALVAVPILIALLGQTALQTKWAGLTDAWLRFGAASLTVMVASYVTFRTVSPYAFASSNWLDLSINHAFRSALAQQRDAINGKALHPPAYQWLLSQPVWDPLENLVVWQLGIPLGIAALIGLALIAAAVLRPLIALARGRRACTGEPAPAAQAAAIIRLMLVAFVLTVFFYFSVRFAHVGRYLLPLMPFLALAAACPLIALRRARREVFWSAASLLLAATSLYALAFRHIYTEPNTRVAATAWIVRNVPAGKTIANEHWDDSLPLDGPAQQYKGIQLPVFDADDETKLRKLYDGLASTDYYNLSSPRAWRTIGRLPDRFPLMVRFYRQLFAGNLGFERAAGFRSEPELFGVRLHDIDAEEAFWVYDHAPVAIFRKIRSLSWARFRTELCEPAPPPAACDQAATTR